MEKNRIVIKFGGVSLKNDERLKNTAEIIKNNADQKLVVVVSAIGDSTNELITAGRKAIGGRIDVKSIEAIHQEICEKLNVSFALLTDLFNQLKRDLQEIQRHKQLDKKDCDLLMSYGERLSVIVMQEYLKELGLNAKALNSWDVGLLSTAEYGNAEILESSKNRVFKNVSELLKKQIIPVITGFISKDESGEITTLGRGGSDLTASYIAAAIHADEVILWKDVQGILSSNPKIVENPVKLNLISFEEASEMAYYGAEILHPQALFPAMENNISVKIKNFLDPTAEGTSIVRKEKAYSPPGHIKTISFRKNITMVHIVSNRMLGHYGFLAKVFEVFDELRISVDMIATSEVSISLTLDESHDLYALEQELSKFASVTISRDKAILSLIGNTENSTKIFNRAFTALDAHDINIKMISYGASNVNVGFIINSDELYSAINVLHEDLIIKTEEDIC